MIIFKAVGLWPTCFFRINDFGIISPTKAIGTAIMSEISKIYNLTTENEVDFHLSMILTRDRYTPMSDISYSLPSEKNKLLDKKGIEDCSKLLLLTHLQ